MGDPGLFSFLGKVGKLAATSIPGPAGAIARKFFQPPTISNGVIVSGFQQSRPTITLPGGGLQVPTPGVGGAIERFLPGGKSGFTTIGPKKRRRMNVLNVKALRRSTRRLAGFQREAKKVEKELRKLAPPARRRSTPHHHHHGHG